jgi:hypothetical protein
MTTPAPSSASAYAPTNAYVALPGDMTWPHPGDLAEVEWTLRYGAPDRSHGLIAASYIAAYRELVWMTQQQRNERVSALRAADRGAQTASEPSEKDGSQAHG